MRGSPRESPTRIDFTTFGVLRAGASVRQSTRAAADEHPAGRASVPTTPSPDAPAWGHDFHWRLPPVGWRWKVSYRGGGPGNHAPRGSLPTTAPGASGCRWRLPPNWSEESESLLMLAGVTIGCWRTLPRTYLLRGVSVRPLAGTFYREMPIVRRGLTSSNILPRS
jgi:hypothetical protein